MSIDNLIPFSELTEEEQRALARKGGQASVKARREKKMMREIINTILEMPLKGDSRSKMVSAEEVSSFAKLKGKNVDVQTGIVMAQVINALKGDRQAAEFLRDTSGQSIANKLDITGALPVVFSGEDKLVDDDAGN